ncbi:L-lactate dehydrogenase [Trachymyrmex septentrionalis]|uniref:L-lactate dehydrogenase n=1 Tax=Trachymyrmex septentrionalis TaxID=34720 RepID=A0A195FQ78_9HYME|nr:PREDICTED: L-lactate dehydrogenase-like [Trachymyrmex septentrionalis]KYN42074.1 L-lactate dehydrogenase [Trachymyrmex septentrionalis]
MVLSPSNSLLPICLRNLTRVTLTRDFVRNRYTRTLPPTILTTILGRDKGKSFGKDATSGSGAQRALNFVSPCLREELLCKMSEPVRDCCHKVTIVGAGMVGVALANSLLFQRITSHIAMVDVFPKKLEGEGMDYHHSSIFIGDPKIEYDTDFCVTSNSKVVAICAGVRPVKGETRLDLVQRNSEILKTIIPPLVNYSPNAVFIVISNPVDILAWVTWKLSGLPVHQVIGSGTHLDTARFRCLIADRLGIAPSSTQAYIIGEHGDSMVPLWSGVSVAGMQFRDIIPNIGLETDDEKWFEIAKYVVKVGAMVRCLKGYSNTAIGLSAADIIIAILRNTQAIMPVSTLVQGHHNVCHDVFLSLPCAVGENGITQIIRMHMTEYEKKLFQESANIVYKVQKDLKIK